MAIKYLCNLIDDSKEVRIVNDTTLGDLCDRVLRDMDFNDDGYVAYQEYRSFTKKAEFEMKQKQAAKEAAEQAANS